MLNRRQFLQSTAACAVGSALPVSMLAEQAQPMVIEFDYAPGPDVSVILQMRDQMIEEIYWVTGISDLNP